MPSRTLGMMRSQATRSADRSEDGRVEFPIADDATGGIPLLADVAPTREVVMHCFDALPAVRSAIERLRAALPRACEAQRADFVVLAVGDVIRALVQSRRAAREVVAEVTALDTEGRDLIALAARLLALSSTAAGR